MMRTLLSLLPRVAIFFSLLTLSFAIATSGSGCGSEEAEIGAEQDGGDGGVCIATGGSCTLSGDCCTANCDPASKACAPSVGGACKQANESCTAPTECCSKICSGGTCGAKLCTSDNEGC